MFTSQSNNTHRSQKAGSWSIHPPRGQSESTLKIQIARLVDTLKDHSIVQKSPVEIWRCREPTYPTGLCMSLQGRIAELSELLLPDKRW